jgi:protein-S-isoprenylcysteine O-methyltransferase Ste14
VHASIGALSESELQRDLALGLLAAAAPVFVILRFVTAPYGRHARGGWGPMLPSRAGWILMELPAVAAFVPIFALGRHRAELVPLVLCAIWLAHYVHRALVFPFRVRSRGKQVPLIVAGLGAAFNAANAYVNARWISELGAYPTSWLGDPRFVGGAALFAVGLVVNLHADTVLIHLRRPGETGYRVPTGGAYRWVSCPNYLGEILEWCGWALATWSLAGLAFAIYTAGNLVPRARSHHAWYRERFADYPRERRALVPFIY